MDCLILVDLQNDFMPKGALAVPRGDEVVTVANQLAARFDFVVASQDWHPPGHQSFASQHKGHLSGETIQLHGVTQVLWPDHCVQGTHGAESYNRLDQCKVSEVFQKGTDPGIDSYSTFFDNARLRSTARAHRLLCLLAYCVEWPPRQASVPPLFADDALSVWPARRDPVTAILPPA